MLINRPHIFKGQRLEVEAVGGVVVGRDRLRIAVDHDGLVAIVLQREGSMAAAVVKLDSLSNTVRAGTEDDDLLLCRWRRFIFLVVAGVEVGGEALKLCRAGIN